ncbi:septum formation initiator [Saccharopolyspora sp. HNM0983]|uniref:Septum formation initiator n=1 Tax=Saccharopolyspora montiporae TaxID=2781240 RepID=A0A929B9S8_9PSEU|nr:septum formation initiator [Saccharopolyspora sp. HNM0983]
MHADAIALVTEDRRTAEEVSRLAAVCGRAVEHHPPAALPRVWRSAAALLLDRTCARRAVELGVPGRNSVAVLLGDTGVDEWRTALRIGARHAFRLPEDESGLLDWLVGAGDGSPPEPGRVLAVLGGCSGAGASVFAAGCAVQAARSGSRAVLVDGDRYGGGADLLVGAEHEAGLRWSGVPAAGTAVGVRQLHAALPEMRLGAGRLHVLSCDRESPDHGLTADAVSAVVAAGRDAGDTVVCDLPPRPDPAASAALALADLVLLVVRPEVRACAAAARTAAHVRESTGGAVRLIARTADGSALSAADARELVGVPLLAAVRSSRTLPGYLERGRFGRSVLTRRGSLARAVRAALAELGATTGPAPVGADDRDTPPADAHGNEPVGAR